MKEPAIFEPDCQVLGTKDAPELLQWLAHSLKTGFTLLLIDLSDVQMLDSSGIGTLMVAANRARRARARFVLCSLSDVASMQIERSGLIDKFEIFQDREEFEQFLKTHEN